MTSGRESSSRSFAPGSGARISVEPTSTAFAPGQLGRGGLRARLDRALGDQHPIARRTGDQLELAAAVEIERREVARVDADHRRVECDGTRELVGVVRLDERVQAERLPQRP